MKLRQRIFVAFAALAMAIIWMGTIAFIAEPPTRAQSTNTWAFDPCLASFIAKSSAPLNAAAAASTTQIVAGVAGKSIYGCGYHISQVATAGTVQWTSGTGGSCGSNAVILTGPMGMTASQPVSYGGAGNIFTAAPGSGVCVTTTGSGGTVSGVISYVVQ